MFESSKRKNWPRILTHSAWLSCPRAIELETLLAQDELDKIRCRFAFQVRCAEKKGSRAGLLARHAESQVRRDDEKTACTVLGFFKAARPRVSGPVSRLPSAVAYRRCSMTRKAFSFWYYSALRSSSLAERSRELRVLITNRSNSLARWGFSSSNLAKLSWVSTPTRVKESATTSALRGT